jgi:hypothetical protein
MGDSTALAELTRCTCRSIDKKGDPSMGPPMKTRQARDAKCQRYSMRRPAGGKPDQLAALKLSLASAISVSFLSAAFSSSRFRCNTLAQSLRPSCFAQAISVPYRAIS